MAGFQGAGRPSQITPVVPVAPTPVVPPYLAPNGPPQPAPDVVNTDLSQMVPRPSLDDLSTQVDRMSLDDIAAQVENPPEDVSQEATGELGLSDLPTQARLSFATSDEQKRATLEKTYGTGNVRKVDDDYQIKRDGKWAKFDRGAWDVVKDLVQTGLATSGIVVPGTLDAIKNIPGDVASNASTALKEAVALPGEAAAAAAAATGIGALPAAGLAAGSRALGGAAGEYAATALQSPLGLENPEDTFGDASNRRAAINGAIRAATGLAGDRLATWAARKAESRLANKAVLDSIPEQTVVSDLKDIAETDKALGVLKKAGVSDEDLKLLPHQILGSPEIKGAAAQASKGQKFRDLVYQQGERVYDTALKVFSHAGNIQAGPSEAASIIRNADQAAGAFIGEARESIKGESIAGKYTQDYLAKLENPSEGFGFATKDGKFSADPKQLETALNVYQSNSTIPQKFEKRIQDVKALFVNNGGKVDAEAANNLYTGLTREINGIKNPEYFGYRTQLINLKNAIRDDVAEHIESKGAGVGATYAGSMKRYRAFREGEEVLGKLFQDGEMTTESLTKYIFNKGPDSLERTQTIKKLLNSQKPEAWDALKGNFLKGLMESNKLEGDQAKRLGQYDWAKIGKQVDSLGDKMVTEIFDTPEAVSNFKNFTQIASKMKASDFEFLSGPKSLPLTKKLKDSAASLIKAIHHQSPGHLAEAAEMWAHQAPDDLAVKFASNGGVEEMLKLVPKREQSAFRDFFAQAIASSQGTRLRRGVQAEIGGAMARQNGQSQ